MNIFKLLGAMLLLVSGLSVGEGLLDQEKGRMDCLAGFVTLTHYIASQIKNYMLPVDEIIHICDEELLAACGVCDRPSSFAELARAVTLPDKSLTECLRGLADSVGNGTRSDEADAFLRCSEQLGGELEKLRRDYSKRRRLILTLSMCVSAGLAIILL